MKHVNLPFSELAGIAVTRGLLGAGLALLVGDRINRYQRGVLGGVLTVVGLLSTLPLAYDVFQRRRVS